MKNIAAYMIAISMALTGCHDSWLLFNVNEEYTAFGRFYGECIGDDCVQTYKLTDKSLYRDRSNRYPDSGPYSWSKQGNDKFVVAREIEGLFPEAYRDQPGIYGCPDCADQGGILYVIEEDCATMIWKLDQDKTQIPSEFHPLVDKINSIIDRIQ